MSRVIRTVIAGAWLLVGSLTPAEAAWTIEDLGTLGGTFSAATAVDGNIVVGTSSITGDGAHHAFAYDRGAATPEMIDLGVLPGGTNSEGVAVSGKIVVGTSETTGGTHAFAYDLAAASPTMIDLGVLTGGTNSEAIAVDGKIVVGNSDTATQKHAFAYDLGAASPTMKDLGTLGSGSELYSLAQGVSGNIVAVQASVSDGAVDGTYGRAAYYDLGASSPSLVSLGTFGGYQSLATAISGSIIVGVADVTPGTVPGDRVFAYDVGAASPTLLDLGTRDCGAFPFAVDGNIVAGGGGCTANVFFADLGQASPSIVDVGNLGGTVFNATGGVSGNLIAGAAQTGPNSDDPLRGYVVDLSETSPSVVPLDPLSGDVHSAALAISGTVIAGISLPDFLHSHAVVWTLTTTTSTTTALTSSANPSVVGQQVTYTATVSPAPDGGTVAFTDGASTISGCGSRPVDTTTGVATCQVPYATPGTHSITAEYSGNDAFETSTSSVVTQKVGYGIVVLSKPPAGKTGWKSGTTVPLRLQLTNSSGSNLSSAGIVLTITGFTPSPAPGTPPSGQFVFSKSQYQLDLKTNRYPVGTYTLSFTASGDPVVHTVTFKIN